MKTYDQWKFPNAITKSMGIGNLGSCFTTHRCRKFRYTLELQQNNSKFIEPIFVKVSSRPAMTIEETEIDFCGNKKWIAGMSRWQDLQVSMYLDNVSLANPKTNEYKLIQMASQLPMQGLTGYLRLLDGCGTEIENWELKNMFCQSANMDCAYNYDVDTTMEMTFKYSDAKYTICVPAVAMPCVPTATPGELAATKRQAIIDKAKVYAPHLSFIEF